MYNDELIESSKIKWQSFLKGDDDAYAWLYSRYVQQLYQYGCRFTTDTEMVKEFFYAVSYAAAMNLHIKVLTPGNNHHMMEAMFKAFAKALDMAVGMDSRITDVLSTKGSL